MKRLLLLIPAFWLSVHAASHKDIEIAIDRYQDRACSAAKAQAKKNYELAEMSQCTCELTDNREWQCFVRFTYTKKIEKAKE